MNGFLSVHSFTSAARLPVGGVTFTVGGAAVTLSGLAIAALCGVILNAILPGNDYEFGISVEGDKSADLGSY